MSEPIPTRESLAGFFVTEPTLGTTRNGGFRLVARVGVEHRLREPDGTLRELEASYHMLAVYGRLAEYLEGRFHRGDRFVAAGHTRSYPIDRYGVTDVRYEFVATRIGHDSALTRYQVDRGVAARHPAGRRVNRDFESVDAAREKAPERRLRAVPDPPTTPAPRYPGVDMVFGS